MTAATSRIQLSRRASFIIAAVAFVMIFTAAGAPIPVYRLYQVEDGITSSELAYVTAAYLGSTFVALLFLGRLSDFIGRKPVMLASLTLAAAGMLTLIAANGLPSVLTARVLMGFASGLAASGLGAFVIDTAPRRPAWLPAMITGSGPMIGLPLGALLAGLLVDTAPQPRTLTFMIIAAILLACTACLSWAAETTLRVPGVLSALRPRVSVPPTASRLLLALGAALVAGWAIGGFYQAFSPTITADYLATDSALVTATVFCSIMIAAPLGAPLAAKLGERRSLIVGTAGFALAMIGATVSLLAGAIVPFLLASVLAGAMQGVFTGGGTRSVMSRIDANQRGATLSSIYIICYSGATLPALVAGPLAGAIPLAGIVTGYLALVLAATTTALITIPRAYRSSPASTPTLR
jgi:MFS family permease